MIYIVCVFKYNIETRFFFNTRDKLMNIFSCLFLFFLYFRCFLTKFFRTYLPCFKTRKKTVRNFSNSKLFFFTLCLTWRKRENNEKKVFLAKLETTFFSERLFLTTVRQRQRIFTVVSTEKNKVSAPSMAKFFRDTLGTFFTLYWVAVNSFARWENKNEKLSDLWF